MDHFCDITDFNRKYAIRLLGRPFVQRRRPGRRPVYSEAIVKHLKALWKLMGELNGKHMKAALPHWVPHYKFTDEDRAMLLAMSAATIDRRLKPYKKSHRRKKRSGTRAGKIGKEIIPVRAFEQKRNRPGFVEADTVAHCGDSLRGEFAWTLTVTDVCTGWTENSAIWAKKASEVRRAVERIERKLPFEILAFHCDNGSEFMNHELIRYLGPQGSQQRESQLMTRSRPYRKNDSAHVEQKNFTHVRSLFNYDRMSAPSVVSLMDSIYHNEHRLLRNFFIPQVRLKRKERIGSKYRRFYTKPKTPYQRMLESCDVSEETKKKLKSQYYKLNPIELRKSLNAKLDALSKALHPKADEIQEAA